MDYERLVLLCDRATNLPPLPASVYKLMEVMEGSAASASQIGAITSSDPMLCAKILRAANGHVVSSGLAPVSSVQAAILRLGHQAVRSMAISLSVQAMFMVRSTDNLFDPLCFARHSTLVGLLSRYVFARHQQAHGASPSDLTPEEVMAGGVLHDLPLALLAFMAPESFDSLYGHCASQRLALDTGFEDLYSGSLREMGGKVMETWGMPKCLALAVRYAATPDEAPEHRAAMRAICYANWVADGLIPADAGTRWSYPMELPGDIQESIGLAQEELDTVIALLQKQ